ncbi:MAG TPA: electron transporter RnfG [Firmicutes bacterium]|nr:electron transporter RnfG [Bacillota bacterium]
MDKKSLYLAFFLGVIGLISAGLISSVNSVTEPIIQERIRVEKQETISEFFPTQSSFEETEISDREYKLVKVQYKVFDSNQEILGYVYEVSVNGYGGTITALISYDEQHDVLSNLKYIGSFSETPGFGTRVKEPEFLDQVINHQVDELNIDTLAGATISSSAVKQAINQATDYYRLQK